MSARFRTVRLARGACLASAVGVACGLATALFLESLARATRLRMSDERVVYALPLAGLVLGTLYDRYASSVRRGANLVIDAIAEGRPQIPLRMAPMVLFGTVLTHLFGGSAGREGTAVQMGASLADELSRQFRLQADERRMMLLAGVGGGFGSVFGTPLAGTVFAAEFVAGGAYDLRAFAPALVAATIGDATTRALGIGHGHPPPLVLPPGSTLTFIKTISLAFAVAATATLFIELTHTFKAKMTQWAPALGLRMFAGGVAVVVLWRVLGTSDYLGLSLPLLERTLSGQVVSPSTFAWKLLLTAVTLGAGFLGGEVTPLFVIGAALGSALAPSLDLPPAFAAAVCMASMFGAASNTPLAMVVMSAELFGTAVAPYVALVVGAAYLLKGRRSIYEAQRRTRLDAPRLPSEATMTKGDALAPQPTPEAEPKNESR